MPTCSPDALINFATYREIRRRESSILFLSFLSFFSFFFCLSRTRFSFSFSPTRLVEYLARPVVLPPRVNLPIRTRNIINCLARIYDYLSRTPTVNNFKTNLKSSVFSFLSLFLHHVQLYLIHFPGGNVAY